ncbi:MAG: hypothetical protein M3P51_13270 [Chloroflexota bacterium]|nr:hypothetical protein [Chloroflexota bacterium]
MANRLDPNQTLAPGQALWASNGRAFLIMQPDGNFVLYEVHKGKHIPVWASSTSGVTRAIMQGDGNLVVHTSNDQPVWDSGTWGNSGAYLIMQDDGNAVVYAQDGRALWASNTGRESRKVGFKPTVHGFRFPNSFVNKVATIPGYGSIETRGRCGGMAYAALDYYYSGVPVPAYKQAVFLPKGSPPDGHWLADYIYARLMNSFFVPSATKFPEWTVHSDHETWFYKGVTKWTKEDEFPKLRACINGGKPAALGLVGADNLVDIGNKNHQVVAYGYDYHPVTKTMTVYVYDNNDPCMEVTLASEPGNPTSTPRTGRSGEASSSTTTLTSTRQCSRRPPSRTARR